MKIEEWKQYYQGMALRGNMRHEKAREMVSNCGGLAILLPAVVVDGKEKTPEVRETQEQAEERIINEILAEVKLSI